MSPNACIDGIASLPFDDVVSEDAIRGAERLRAGRFRATGVSADAAVFLAMVNAPFKVDNAGSRPRDETPGRTLRQVARVDKLDRTNRSEKLFMTRNACAPHAMEHGEHHAVLRSNSLSSVIGRSR